MLYIFNSILKWRFEVKAASPGATTALLSPSNRLADVLRGDDSDSVFCHLSSLRCCCLTEDRLCHLKGKRLKVARLRTQVLQVGFARLPKLHKHECHLLMTSFGVCEAWSFAELTPLRILYELPVSPFTTMLPKTGLLWVLEILEKLWILGKALNDFENRH